MNLIKRFFKFISELSPLMYIGFIFLLIAIGFALGALIDIIKYFLK